MSRFSCEELQCDAISIAEMTGSSQRPGDIPIPIPKRRCEITIISFSRSICRGGLAALVGVTGKPYPNCLSCRSHPIRPCGAPSPRGEGCDTRIPSSKKRRRSRPCEPIRSPSTVIPSAAEGSLLHCRHMHTCALVQTTSWCFLFCLSLAHDLPLCKKDPSTSALMTRKKDGSFHIVFHTAA